MGRGARVVAGVVAICSLIGPAAACAGPDTTPRPIPLPSSAWRPGPGLAWDIQYAGEIDVARAVRLGLEMVNLDLDDTPQVTIEALQSEGIRVICYLSAGSWEPYRTDADDFPDEVIGEAYEGFEDERWLDIRSRALRPILRARLERARAKGCDAVDPDNVNGYENETGFPLTAADQLTFNRWLFDESHRHGLAVGLKNDVEQAGELLSWVEFQVNEECLEQGDACAALRIFVDVGKPVWSIEYAGDRTAACEEAERLGFDTIFKRRELDAFRLPCWRDGLPISTARASTVSGVDRDAVPAGGHGPEAWRNRNAHDTTLRELVKRANVA